MRSLLSSLKRTSSLKRGSLRTNLIAGSVVVLSLLLIVFGLFVRTVVATTLIASADRELENRAARPVPGPPPPPRADAPPDGGNGLFNPGPPDLTGRDGFRPPPGDERPLNGNRPLNEDRPPGFGDGNPDRPRRFDLSGHPLDPFDSSPALDPAGLKAAAQGKRVLETVTAGGQPVRVLSLPRLHGRGSPAIIQTAYPLDKIDEATHGVDIALLILIPFALVCAGFGGYWITERVLSRVRGMVRSAGQIGAQDLSQRLPVIGSDEFSELADTFNGLLGRVETAFQEQQRIMEQQRRFIADASHELKTPLTVIRGTTSLALSGADQGVLDRQATCEIDLAAAAMSDLVQDLLYLAHADAGRLGRERVELLVNEPIRRAVAMVAPGSKAPIHVALGDAPLTVRANPGELTRLLTNLLENAARHTPADGSITIRAQETANAVAVSIADTGIGIAPEHLGHLCERFYRVDSARSRDGDGAGGTGLGLAICKGIVDAHGGSLEIASVLGSGTTVTVTLPRVEK